MKTVDITGFFKKFCITTRTIEAAPNALIINGQEVYSESDASRIKWKNCGAEYIVESTGAFNTYYHAALRRRSGASSRS